MKSSDELASKQIRESKVREHCYRVWTIIGAIILAVALGYVLNVLSIPVGIIIWSGIIVFVLRTPVNRLEKMGINRLIGSGIAFAGMFVLLLGLGFLMFSPAFGIGDQFMNLAESIPAYIDQLIVWYTQTADQYSGFLQNETVQTWLNEVTSSAGTWATQLAQGSADGLVAIGSTVVNSFVVIGFSFVVAYWILMDLPAIGKECRRLVAGKREEDAYMLYITFTRVIGGYIKATLLQCILIGLGCGIAFAIIGIPNAAALGGIAGLLNIIPVVGPWLGGALAAIVGVFISPWVALIAFVSTIIIQQLIYTFVSPKLMADSVDIHPALVILALLAGSAAGGAMNGLMGSLVGMLVSIPAVAAAKAIFVYYFEKRTGRRIVSEDGVFFKGSAGDISSGTFDPIVDAATPVDVGAKEELEKVIEDFEGKFKSVKKQVYSFYPTDELELESNKEEESSSEGLMDPKEKEEISTPQGEFTKKGEDESTPKQ